MTGKLLCLPRLGRDGGQAVPATFLHAVAHQLPHTPLAGLQPPRVAHPALRKHVHPVTPAANWCAPLWYYQIKGQHALLARVLNEPFLTVRCREHGSRELRGPAKPCASLSRGGPVWLAYLASRRAAVRMAGCSSPMPLSMGSTLPLRKNCLPAECHASGTAIADTGPHQGALGTARHGRVSRTPGSGS